ncbi:MAG: tetratricopeptide repeat protein [Treponema sp.]|jgi:tetratricopeptide (TPR) repeat protein|nr:tetratricopeptide repeat protein [Treponema sp.]
MKSVKNAVAIITAVGIVIIAAYGISMNQRYKQRGELAGRIFSLSNENSLDKALQRNPPETIEELKRAIAFYEKRLDRHVEDVFRTGLYWKILAVRLQDRGLHGEALAALENAVYHAPEDASLHYSIGISAGILAKSFHTSLGGETNNRHSYFILAEEAFLRAIDLDSRYLRPRYGLGVMYTFDLDRPEEAIPHLERCLEISRNDVDTMFVLARAFYMTRKYQAAVDLYDRIITLTRDEQKRRDAQNNRQTVLGQMYG